MLPKFLFGSFKKVSKDMHPAGVSRLRKIVIWIVIVGFWILYYWFNDPSAP